MKKLFIACLSFLSLQLMANNINWTLPATQISTAGQNASDPRIAMDANGDVVAVWIENNIVKSSSKPANGNWTTVVTLSNSTASSPHVVMDLNGNATAVWIENGVTKASSKPFNGIWSNEVSLSSSGAASPDLAVDSAGDVVAIWTRNGDVESSTKLFGASWQSRVVINTTGATVPRIAIGGSGSNTRAVVAWDGTSGSTNVVYSSTKLISGTWSAQQIISDSSHQAGFCNVAVDTCGNATAVWYLYDVTGSLFSNVTVQSATRPAAGSWCIPVSLSEPGMRDPSTLVCRVAYDSNGNAVAFWNNSFDASTFNYQSAVKPVRQQWTAPVNLISSNTYAYSSSLAASALGDALSVYMFSNGNNIIVQSIESDISGPTQNIWSAPVNLSTGADNAYPRLATILNGNVIYAATVWTNYNGTNNTIVAATGTRTLILPPSNLSVAQHANNFGIFTEYYNTVSWTLSNDASVVGYNVYRNGVLIDQVGAGVSQFVDNNMTQNGSATYGVSAFNIQGSQSRIVSVSFP